MKTTSKTAGVSIMAMPKTNQNVPQLQIVNSHFQDSIDQSKITNTSSDVITLNKQPEDYSLSIESRKTKNSGDSSSDRGTGDRDYFINTGKINPHERAYKTEKTLNGRVKISNFLLNHRKNNKNAKSLKKYHSLKLSKSKSKKMRGGGVGKPVNYDILLEKRKNKQSKLFRVPHATSKSGFTIN